MTVAAFQLGEVRIEVVRKDIRHVHLTVHPPAGRVRIAAPRRLSDDAIRAFAIGKLAWIRRQRAKLREQEREIPLSYIDRETHFVWGQRCLLRVIECDASPSVEWRPGRLVLSVRSGTVSTRRAELLDAWYREQLRVEALPLLARWQDRLGVQAKALFVQRMRTRWGSCNAGAGNIRLNTELARKPRQCLEYILVHELAHLVEPTHGPAFLALLDRHLPGWKQRREMLNRLPVRHEEWEY